MCTKMIIQAGITKIIYAREFDSYLSYEMAKESEIEIIKHEVWMSGFNVS